jgi:hypothetical protein
MKIAEILLLGVVAAFWPVLLVVVAVALRTPHPPRILAGFLAGGMIACVAVGAAVVHLLRQSSVVMASQHHVDPIVNLVCGALALLAALALSRFLAARRASPRPPKPAAEGPSRTERLVGRGAALAFVVGVILDIVPGVVPAVALKDIAQLGGGVAETVGLLVAFYLVMFALIELPLVGYLVAPDRTSQLATRLNAWLTANMGRLATWALVAAGVILILRGLVAAVSG